MYMKNKFWIFIVTLLFVVNTSCFNYAQNNNSFLHLSILGAYTLPHGYFGLTQRASGMVAYRNQSQIPEDKSGYADIGYGTSIEISIKVYDNIRWLSTFSYMYNEFLEKYYPNLTYSFPLTSEENYNTFWLLTGIAYEMPLCTNVRIYGFGQVGMINANFPKIIYSDDHFSIISVAESDNAFATSLGVGVILYNVNVGMRFYMGETEHKQTSTRSWDEVSWTENLAKPKDMLQLILGFTI